MDAIHPSKFNNLNEQLCPLCYDETRNLQVHIKYLRVFGAVKIAFALPTQWIYQMSSLFSQGVAGTHSEWSESPVEDEER